MKKCKYCQSEIDNQAKICPNCRKKQGLGAGKIALIVIGVLILIGILFGGNNNNTPTSTSPSSNSTTSTSTNNNNQEEKTLFEQNEVVEFNGVKYSVINVEKSNGAQYDTPASGKEYVIVTIKIENTSAEKISYNSFDWKMINSNGQEEGTTFSIINSETALSSGDLASGGNVQGTLIFEQPKGDTGLKLNYYNNLFNENQSFQIKIN